MRPSARQLIESVDWALQEKVAPTVEDKWAASALRSAHCLLQHLSVRVELEGQLLHDDSADLRTVLAGLPATLDGAPADHGGDLRKAIAGVLDRRWRDEGAYPTIASLSEENIALREVADDVIRRLRAEPVAADDAGRAALSELEAYVHRRLQREQPLFIPAFLASTF